MDVFADMGKNMKVLKIDSFNGVSGDMLLSALIDTGIPESKIFEPVRQALGDESISLYTERVKRGAFSALKLVIDENNRKTPFFRDLHALFTIVDRSSLSELRKIDARRCLENLARVEARIHGIPLEKVHFHEVGGVDTLIDTIGFMAALDYLEIEEVFVSPVAAGNGMVTTEHGEMPLPVPAVVDLLKGLPIQGRSSIQNMELCTPTGAMLLAGVGKPIHEMPDACPVASGYGAGHNNPEGFANCLRVIVMEALSEGVKGDINFESMIQAEAVIDDQTPEQIAWASAQLERAGAVETSITPVTLKKRRPGFRLGILFNEKDMHKIFHTLFLETTSLGVRYYPVRRQTLQRQIVVKNTPWGKVSVKQGILNGEVVTSSPEYQECAAIAERENVPLKEVFKAAQ